MSMETMAIYEFDVFCLDARERLLLRNDKPLELTPKAFDALLALLENSGRLLTKRELMEKVWPGVHVDEHNLMVTIATLRKALGRDHNGNQYIETIPTKGYRFSAMVQIRNLQSTAEERSTLTKPSKKLEDEQGDGDLADASTPAAKTGVPLEAFWGMKYALLGLLALACAVWVAFLGFSSHRVRSRAPVRVSFTVNEIRAFGEQDELLWTYTFPKALHPYYLSHRELVKDLVRIADLKGDGDREVLVTAPLKLGPNADDPVQTEVDCFSSRGRLLWSYIPQETFQFGNHELTGPWYVSDIFVSSKGPAPAIWVALVHHEWGNSFVVRLDATSGKDTLRFVNTGALYKLNEITTNAGSYLLAAGFNNEYAAGSLTILDESKSFSVSPQSSGTRHKCLSCPQGDPDYYFVFPKSEINIQRRAWEDSITLIGVEGKQFEVSKADLGNGGPQLEPVRSIYRFHTEPVVEPFSFRFDSAYDMLHRDLEREGRIDHSLDECPERLHPKPVRVWRPVNGWTEINFNPMRAAD